MKCFGICTDYYSRTIKFIRSLSFPHVWAINFIEGILQDFLRNGFFNFNTWFAWSLTTHKHSNQKNKQKDSVNIPVDIFHNCGPFATDYLVILFSATLLRLTFACLRRCGEHRRATMCLSAMSDSECSDGRRRSRRRLMSVGSAVSCCVFGLFISLFHLQL